ncbi:MAG: glycosyltransferase family 1 protein [Ilumatobacter fluminis]|uniref:glycosyltransferase family 4 protein n=1 Tax=Ilumatobacter fluminis TaxID=467091 RepID=UPI0032F01718
MLRTLRPPTPSPRSLRVAIVAESFLPNVNGVTNSVLRLLEHLRDDGHRAIVIAPGPGDDFVEGIDDVEVVRVRGFDLPRYPELRVGLPSLRIRSTLREFRPDVVHLAAPAVLGATAARVAGRAGIPSIAVFQTDLAGFAKRHGLNRVTDGIWNYLRWVHGQSALTLAPSSVTAWALRARGIENTDVWARGVDLDRFDPRHRSDELHRFLAPNDEVVVGFIGRLAKEKQVERLAPLLAMPNVRVVVVGDGPERDDLQRKLPGARFVGFQSGQMLSALAATFDVFVHTGVDETYCQALQEAMASGVSVVAPSAGGPLDFVQHRHSGLFWSPEVPETLVGAVDELARDPALRARLGTAARAEVEQRPWPVIMDELIGHYRAVIEAPAAEVAA